MRVAVIVVLFLAACSNGGTAPAEQGESIACALGGSLQFKPDCTVERQGSRIVVRLPDGAFHRFTLSKDGQSLDAADGADIAQSARKGDRFEVILGQDRYVIPVGAGAAKP
ncbi:MAG: hypothetical protein ACKOOL_01530 [Novosphingobium sp.]